MTLFRDFVYNIFVQGFILHLIIWYDFAAWCRPIVILLSGDVGSIQFERQSLSIYYLNLNNICLLSSP